MKRCASPLRVLLPALVLLMPVSSAHAAVIHLAAVLNGAQEVPPNASTAIGFGTFFLDDAALTMTYDITVYGLDFTGTQTSSTLDNLVAAHIHAPAPPGVNAG